MRRPRAWFAATPPGGPGSPSAPTTWGCLQWLDEAWMKGGESCLDAVSAPGSTVPADRKAAGGAPCGERALQGTSTQRGVGPLVAPHGAPFPRIGRGAKEDGPPRGLDKEYGRRSVG